MAWPGDQRRLRWFSADRIAVAEIPYGRAIVIGLLAVVIRVVDQHRAAREVQQPHPRGTQEGHADGSATVRADDYQPRVA